MRVLIALHQFFPEMSAGTEVLALNCGRELRQLGHEVAFFASTATVTVGDPSSVTAQTYDQFTVFHLRHGSSALVNATSVSAADSSVLEGFRQAVQTFAPDIVHFMHFMRLTMSPLEVCTELNIPAVVTPTDFWLLCPTAQLRDPVAGNFCGGPTTQATNCIRHFAVESLPAPLHRAAAATPLAIYTLAVALLPWMPQRFSQRAERAVELVDRIQQVRAHLTKVRYFFSPTEHIQRMLIGLGVQQERIGLVPYGVPTPALQMQQKCAPRSAAAKALRIGFIGTFAEHKGAHVLLAALQQLPDADLHVRLYGGAQHYPKYAQQLIELAGSDPRISFCGEFPADDIDAILSQLDTLIIPSVWYENTPLVMLSALAAGCPIIASNVAGMTDHLRHNVNSLLFDAGDCAGLAAQIARMCNESGLHGRLCEHIDPPATMANYVATLAARYAQLIPAAKVVQ